MSVPPTQGGDKLGDLITKAGGAISAHNKKVGVCVVVFLAGNGILALIGLILASVKNSS